MPLLDGPEDKIHQREEHFFTDELHFNFPNQHGIFVDGVPLINAALAASEAEALAGTVTNKNITPVTLKAVLPFKQVKSYLDLPAALAGLSSGDRLKVTKGIYPIILPLTPPSGVEIDFEPDAIIQVPAGCNFHAIDINGKTDVTLNKPKVVKAAGAAAVGNVAAVRVSGASEDITINGGYSWELGRGFDIDGINTTTRRITLNDYTAESSVQYGLALAQCDVVHINNFRSLSSGLDGIKALYSARNVDIDGFYLTGATGGDGIDTYGGGGTWKILNGTAEANGQGGVIIKSSTDNASKIAVITAADDLFTKTAHNHISGTPIVFSFATAAPIVNGTTYYIRDVTANTFKVAATLGGPAIDITSDGSATFRVVGADYVNSMIVDNIRCINNGGYGFSVHRHSADTLDNVDEPLPAHILVGSVITEGNNGYGAYFRASGVIVAQLIANNNGRDGIMVDAACIDVRVNSWFAAGNGTTTPSSDDGFHVEGGIRIYIGPGTALGTWVKDARTETDISLGTATQRYGLRIEAATTSYVVHAPDGDYNLLGLFSDACGKGWVLPSAGFPNIVMPNNQQFLVKTVAGVNQRAIYMTTSDVVEFGNTSTETTIRALSRVLFPGLVRMAGALDHDGTTVGFYGATPVARAAAIASPTADVASLKTAVDAIRTALANIGITS